MLVEGPSSKPELASSRQPLRLSRALLTPIVIENLNRGVRHKELKKQWNESQVDKKWEESNWAKKRAQIQTRRNLTDFERFKVMRLKKQARFEERKSLAKVKASA